MSVKYMSNQAGGIFAWLLLLMACLIIPGRASAMPPGTLLFRTGSNGQMFGYQGDLLTTEKGIIQAINAGHVAVYIGREQGIDYVVEATPAGVVKTPARYFVNRAENETFLGARLPSGLDAVRQAKVVAIARNLAASNLAYDFDFHRQKGAGSGDWTCVGVSEKIYESADISNPYNLGALEYDQRYYAIDITPDGFDHTSPANSQGDRFSRDKEFSEIARRPKMLFPAPELIGFNAGVEKDGRRYLFMPYTQFVQPRLEPVAVDISIATSVPASVRPEINGLAIGLRWSLINNPLSSLKQLAGAVQKAATWFGDFLKGPDKSAAVVIDDNDIFSSAPESVVASTSRPVVVVTKSAGPSAASSLPPVIPAADRSASTSSPQLAKNNQRVVVQARPDTPEPTAAPAGATTPAVRPLYNLPATSSLAAKTAATTTNIKTDPQAQAAADAPKIARLEAIYATGNDDWVELYNPQDYDFDLAASGYRLEKTKTAADPSLMMRIGNLADGSYPGGTIIKAHGRYLIVRAGAGEYYRSRAQALATRTEFSWAGSGQTIYLATGAVSSASDEDIVEAVGFGAATYYQGSGSAPEIRDKYVLRRQASQQNNATDFKLVASDDPSLVWDENVPDSESEQPPDPEDDPVPPPAPRLLIRRVYATGANDWLEIYNPNDFAVDLAAQGFRLEKTKSAQDPSLMLRFGNPADGSYPGGTVIEAGGTYLVVRDEASEYYRGQADAISTRTEFGWTGNGYTIYLASGPVSSSVDEDIIEAVGFGSEASYFAGSGPAPEINDGYALERQGDSGDNLQDFRLVPEADPDFEREEAAAAEPRYVAPTPINSPGLANIWHFDECYGAGNWTVGRWDCAREIGYNIPGFELDLEPAPDLDAFTLAFYYSDRGQDPRVDMRLRGPDESTALVRLERNLATFEGLPNSKWRYYQELPFDGQWHQAVIVVNQAADYWAAYLDGVQIVHEDFLANLPVMDRLEISSDLSPTLIDEVAVWHRALDSDEIAAIFTQAAPLAPVTERPQPEVPVLRYQWNFQEDEGAVATDSVQGAVMNVDPGLWTGRRHNDYALQTGLSAGASAVINWPLTNQDFSLAYWWQNTAYPQDGQAEITLWGGLADEKRLLRLDNNYFRLNYSFNGWDGILVEGLGAGLPLDDLWHHIALVYDSYRYKLSLFVDGQEKLVRPHIWPLPEYALRRLEIGKSTWPAAIDDLRIYSGALNATEVRELFTNTK